MKHIFLKTALAALLMGGVATSCINDLNISSIDPQSSSSYGDMELLAKIYSTLGLTGQKGPAGSGDISSDEGESGFYRTTFNLQELCTDECLWAWQTDPDIPQITNIDWTASSVRVQWAFQRLAFDVTLCNFYLTNTEDKAEDPDYKLYRAEVRFLRALHMWYFLDLWGKAPFKTTYDIYELPVEKAGKELYDWIDKELTEIEPDLAEVGAFNNSSNFGRADKGAAYMLHARLALNSAVYTKGAVKDYQKAIDYCDLLDGKYELSKTEKNGYTGYEQVFMADNDQNQQAMKEIEDCPLATEKAPDGATEAEIIALDAAAGTATKDVQEKANDHRALFYSGCGGGLRKLQAEQIAGFNSGLAIVKWSNIRTDGAATSHNEFPDVDIPLIRFGLFTGDKYVWDFKGGVAEGKSVENFFNVYPIPADDINGNKNLTQNPRY